MREIKKKMHLCSSGFYYDAQAGWYYNTHDGQYYIYENEAYVPLSATVREETVLRGSYPVIV